MFGVDMVMCQFKFSGVSASDVFICTDRYSTGTSIPGLDSQDDIDDVATEKFFDTDNKLADLAAVFKRKLVTDDITQDFTLRDGDTLDAVWAWGYIQSGTP